MRKALFFMAAVMLTVSCCLAQGLEGTTPTFTMQPLAVGLYTTYLQWEKGEDVPIASTFAIVGRDDSTWTVEMRYFGLPFAQGKVVGLEEAIATGDPTKARLVAHRYDNLKWHWSDSHQKVLDNLLQFNMLGPVLRPEQQLRRVEHASAPCGGFPRSISDVWAARNDNGGHVRCIAWRDARVPLSGIVKLEGVCGSSDASSSFMLAAYGADFDTSGYTRFMEIEGFGEKAFCDSLARRNATLSPGQFVRYATWTEHEDVPTILTIAVVAREKEGPVCEIRRGEDVIQFLVTGIEQARRSHDKRKVRVRWCRSFDEKVIDEKEQFVLSEKHSKPTSEEWEIISYFLDLGLFGEILPTDIEMRDKTPNFFGWFGGIGTTAQSTWYIDRRSGAGQYCLAQMNPIIPISGLVAVHTELLPRTADNYRYSELRSDGRHLTLLDYGYDARPSF